MGGLTTNAAWNGVGDINVLPNSLRRLLQPATTHHYTVTVNATVGSESTIDRARLRDRRSGNRHRLSEYGDGQQPRRLVRQSACSAPVSPTLDKTFVSATQHLTAGAWDGSWDVTYTVAVDNPSPTTGLIYSLSDTPGFPAGVTINGGTVVGSDGTDPITVLNPSVPGGVTFGIVDGRSLPAGGTDTYTIVLNATVPADFDPALGECTENTAGNGFYNLADATSGQDSFTDHDCGGILQIPNPTVTKTVVGEPVQGSDGAWTITYDVVAANPDATLGTVYDLTDTLAFGAGITVTSATVTGPVGVTVNPGWNGASDTSVIRGRFLAGGASETYRVVVTATVASDATRTCDTGGFRNNSHVDLVVPTPPGPPPGLRTALWVFAAAAAAAALCHPGRHGVRRAGLADRYQDGGLGDAGNRAGHLPGGLRRHRVESLDDHGGQLQPDRHPGVPRPGDDQPADGVGGPEQPGRQRGRGVHGDRRLGQRWTARHRYGVAGRQEGHLPGVRAGHRACGYSDDRARVFRDDVGARLLQRRPNDQWRGRL